MCDPAHPRLGTALTELPRLDPHHRSRESRRDPTPGGRMHKHGTSGTKPCSPGATRTRIGTAGPLSTTRPRLRGLFTVSEWSLGPWRSSPHRSPSSFSRPVVRSGSTNPTRLPKGGETHVAVQDRRRCAARRRHATRVRRRRDRTAHPHLTPRPTTVRKEVTPMSKLKNIAATALLAAGPIAFLVIETAGWRRP
jgi:hypothetical protein